jgi:hypothetical protein
VLTRATTALEGAATPEARKSLAADLAATKDPGKIDELLGKPAAPKPPKVRPPTKASLGVDRTTRAWEVFRKEERKFAEDHSETLTDDQLDLRADLRQIVWRARAKQFDNWAHATKIEILDRYDALAKQSGMLQTWINNARGALAEALFIPGYGRSKPVFHKQGVEGATIPDYSIVHQGFTEWINLKSDLIDQGPKQRSGAYQAGVDAAGGYLKTIRDKDALNVPTGDKMSLDCVRDPGPVTRQRMLDILQAPGSPVYRVRFGTGNWIENPNP